LCNKLSTLGFCYRDGTPGKEDKLNEHGVRCKISTIPTWMELISYSSYPCTCYVGPFFEYKDYLNFIERKEVYAGEVPFPVVRGTLVFLRGMLCMGIAIWMQTQASGLFVASKGFADSNWFMQQYYCFMLLAQFKYGAYTVWSFADGVNLLSGLRYGGKDKDGNDDFQRNVACNLVECELAYMPRMIINNWNLQVALWLRYYTYERIENGDKRNRGTAAFVTFMVSAFWHGFMPCYYGFFIGLHLLLEISRSMFKLKSTIEYIPYYIRLVLGLLLTQFFIVHLGCIYQARTGENMWGLWTNTYFVCPVLLIVIFTSCKILESVFAKPRKDKSSDKKEKKE
jgi:lysophospholipid acyltransferase